MKDIHIFNDVIGYYVAVGAADIDTAIDGLEGNSIEVPARPTPHHAWENDQWVDRYVAPTPEEVRASMLPLTRRQFRLGMHSAGITTTQIEDAIAGIADENQREIAEIEWQEATQFERTHDLVDTLSGALGLSDEQVDGLWQNALAL